MTRKKKASKSALDYVRLPQMPDLELEDDTKKGIIIIITLAGGALSFLSLFGLAGNLGEFILSGLKLALGWGKVFFPFIVIFWAYAMYDQTRFNLRGKNYIGLVIFLLSFQAFLLLFIEYSQWDSALEIGRGGGYIGWLLGSLFMSSMGLIASFLISLCLIIISILLIFETSLTRLFGRDSLLMKILHPIRFLIAKIVSAKNGKKIDEDLDEDALLEEDQEDQESELEDLEEFEASKTKIEEFEEETVEEPELEDLPIINKKLSGNKHFTDDIWWQHPMNIDIKFPLNLLNDNTSKATSGDIENNKETIQKTLENFNIRVEMGDVAVGPTVTQFTFKPAEGVKVSKITNLGNDLALAMAKHPIRIEAPIPGKSLVGVEVPNDTKAMVGFKEVLASKSYRSRENDMMLVLGKDVSGSTWVSDLTRMPHLLVAGATNSGKSVCLNTIIVSLMYQNSPDNLRFIMVDPKRVELTTYDGMPYLLTPVITDVNKTINALKWCLSEMDRRYDLLNKVGTKNIQNYNASHEIKMPYIVFVIDELADLMVTAARDIEGAIIRLAQMSRAVGIHLILATQRPSVDVITGLIKANMPARIAFSVASGTDSRTILDSLGAEKLLGRGDMLFQTAEISKPKRIQGAFLSEEEIKKIVRYSKQKGHGPKFVEGITEKQKAQGIGGIGLDGTTGDEDDLLLEAKEVVINMGKASASLLQRKLRVGYSRAASIIDQLEEIGVVGPANGSKPREILVTKQQLEKMSNEGISGVSLHRREEAVAPENYLGEEAEIPPIFRNLDKEENEDEEIEEDENEDTEAEEDIFATETENETSELDEEAKTETGQNKENTLKIKEEKKETAPEDEDELFFSH